MTRWSIRFHRDPTLSLHIKLAVSQAIATAEPRKCLFLPLTPLSLPPHLLHVCMAMCEGRERGVSQLSGRQWCGEDRWQAALCSPCLQLP